jgi:hypothetical protein
MTAFASSRRASDKPCRAISPASEPLEPAIGVPAPPFNFTQATGLIQPVQDAESDIIEKIATNMDEF